MKTEYTQGPFLIRNQGLGHYTLEKITGDSRSVLATAFETTLGDDHGGTVAGNMTLWASAPELLGACRSALRALRDNLQPGPFDGDAKTALELVIAKATGGAV